MLRFHWELVWLWPANISAKMSCVLLFMATALPIRYGLKLYLNKHIVILYW